MYRYVVLLEFEWLLKVNIRVTIFEKILSQSRAQSTAIFEETGKGEGAEFVGLEGGGGAGMDMNLAGSEPSYVIEIFTSFDSFVSAEYT